jgi:class 3 adenylate cyclase
MREPVQVFMLLETLYHEFDQIAKRRRVFKVETIGDCYVAVCGLPEPRKDHATVMVRRQSAGCPCFLLSPMLTTFRLVHSAGSLATVWTSSMS